MSFLELVEAYKDEAVETKKSFVLDASKVIRARCWHLEKDFYSVKDKTIFIDFLLSKDSNSWKVISYWIEFHKDRVEKHFFDIHNNKLNEELLSILTLKKQFDSPIICLWVNSQDLLNSDKIKIKYLELFSEMSFAPSIELL